MYGVSLFLQVSITGKTAKVCFKGAAGDAATDCVSVEITKDIKKVVVDGVKGRIEPGSEFHQALSTIKSTSEHLVSARFIDDQDKSLVSHHQFMFLY